jgi:hypothetical protein
VKGPIGVCADATEEDGSARRKTGNVSFMTGELLMHLEVQRGHAALKRSRRRSAMSPASRPRSRGADERSRSAEITSCDAVAIDAIANGA